VTLETQFEIALRLLLACVLGSLIGLDRERKKFGAGVRTHMLIASGACLFTALSVYGFSGGDPARVASQILPGLGFLGAGAILKYKNSVRGITTAASIWVTAAMGMAVGVGAWFLAMTTTLMIWFVLVIVKMFEHRSSATADEENQPID
jgi:putative Mg2+ transporter-C (MgtC) family protein